MAAVGIDFGYSTLRVRIFRSKTDIDIIQHSVPVVAIDVNKELFIGEDLSEATSFETVILGIKRIIGRLENDQVLIKQLEDDSLKFNFDGANLKIETNKQPLIDRISTEDLLAMIFEKIIKAAETYLSKFSSQKVDVKKAVISFSSYFRHTQRVTVLNAAKIAGLQVLRLSNDTTAVA
ncbi:Hsp70 chaperone Hsp88-like protein, partial [Leptotrombidium deliense]